MAMHHSHADAMRLAGDLYRRMLDRNADKEGFAYVLDSLQTGRFSVREHALQMVASQEFDERFVKGRTGGATVALLNRIFLGHATDDATVAEALQDYRELGLLKYAEQLTESEEYQSDVGEDRVPGMPATAPESVRNESSKTESRKPESSKTESSRTKTPRVETSRTDARAEERAAGRVTGATIPTRAANGRARARAG